MSCSRSFLFPFTNNLFLVIKQIMNLYAPLWWIILSCKTAWASGTPAKIFKQKGWYFGGLYLHVHSLNVLIVLFALKHANITHVCKKSYRGSKDNYFPVSFLPVISKIVEKLLRLQINFSMQQFLSKYQCGFRKGSSV